MNNDVRCEEALGAFAQTQFIPARAGSLARLPNCCPSPHWLHTPQQMTLYPIDNAPQPPTPEQRQWFILRHAKYLIQLKQILY